MTRSFASLALDPACRLSVVIPANDEVGEIARALDALVRQRALDGAPLAPQTFDVLVYANNCTDRTADVVRAVAAAHPSYAIHIAEAWLPAPIAHVGTARRRAMNAAAARYREAGREGVLASTDADTAVSTTWIATTLADMDHADAVLGRILVDPAQWAALPAHTRRRLREEDTYHFLVAQLESLVDPSRYGAWPRHWQRSGPSFAVRVSAYQRAGGVPPVPLLEDIALYRALAATGARMRQSLRVRVFTSARSVPRAHGGFGSRVARWNADGASDEALLVEHPDRTIERILRGDDRVIAGAHDDVPISQATSALRQVIAGGASALRATRNSVASIAG